MELLKNYTNELIRRKYAQNSIKTYVNCFQQFLDYFKGSDYRYISDEAIKNWLLWLVQNKQISNSYQNQLINAVKFYYEGVLHLPRKCYYIDRPRVEHKLPVILSPDEVARIYNSINNLKHKAIVALLYSTGMRVSEIINLKVCNIDSAQMIIIVQQAKGHKDRIVPLSHNTLSVLRDYVKAYKPIDKRNFLPSEYLFKGQFSEKYSRESIQQFLNSYAAKAKIVKNVYPHLLRHSCFTSLRDAGTDISIIQQFAGHKNPKTTLLYAQLSTSHINKVFNPFDQIKI